MTIQVLWIWFFFQFVRQIILTKRDNLKKSQTMCRDCMKLFEIILDLFGKRTCLHLFGRFLLLIRSLFWFYCLIEQSVGISHWRVPTGETSPHLPPSASLIIEANVMLIITESSCWPLIYIYILNSKTEAFAVCSSVAFIEHRNETKHENKVQQKNVSVFFLILFSLTKHV